MTTAEQLKISIKGKNSLKSVVDDVSKSTPTINISSLVENENLPSVKSYEAFNTIFNNFSNDEISNFISYQNILKKTFFFWRDFNIQVQVGKENYRLFKYRIIRK